MVLSASELLLLAISISNISWAETASISRSVPKTLNDADCDIFPDTDTYKSNLTEPSMIVSVTLCV